MSNKVRELEVEYGDTLRLTVIDRSGGKAEVLDYVLEDGSINWKREPTYPSCGQETSYRFSSGPADMDLTLHLTPTTTSKATYTTADVLHKPSNEEQNPMTTITRSATYKTKSDAGSVQLDLNDQVVSSLITFKYGPLPGNTIITGKISGIVNLGNAASNLRQLANAIDDVLALYKGDEAKG